jgi:hypothetical protein
MKKIIILKNNSGRLANQIWNYANVICYCLEKNYQCENPAFFKYHQYFYFEVTRRYFFRFLINLLSRLSNRLAKLIYYLFVQVVCFFNSKKVVKSASGFLLSPSANSNREQREVLDNIDQSKIKVFYFCGWLFDNPAGLSKYRRTILEYFKPKEHYWNEVQKFIKELRGKNKKVIGVHIRQNDYKNWNSGKFYFSNQEVRRIVDDYIKKNNINILNTVFVICSDGPIEDFCFNGINFIHGPGSEILDLYVLSQTDTIIGSNSTYGSWAAYYGNIPLYYFSKDKIDWGKPDKPPEFL